MIRMVLLAAVLTGLLGAATLEPDEPVLPMVIADQFETPRGIGNEHFWVVAWDRETTQLANRFFAARKKLLSDGTAALIVDVSQTPSGIMELFVLPRMRSYDHPILLSYDAETNRRFPYREGCVTLLRWERGVLAEVGFASDGETLGHLLGQ